MNTEYKTTSLNEAALLAASGYRLQNITKQEDDPKTKIFIFEDDGSIADYINQYYNGELRIDPYKLLTEFKNLKTRVLTPKVS